MPRRPFDMPKLRLVTLLGASAAILVAAGCGSVGYHDGSGDKARGKELFKQNCGSCHVLADAGTTGTIGPSLDAAFAQSRKDGMGEESIVQVVRGQIAYPVVDPSTGAPGMPADIVTGQDADDVAAYVASVAGREGVAPPPSPQPPPATSPSPPSPPSGGGGAAEGKEVFESAGCAGCHALADAGATGAVGPNLDETKPSKALVVERVTNGKGAMPAFAGQLDEAQIDAVADYVSGAAG